MRAEVRRTWAACHCFPHPYGIPMSSLYYPVPMLFPCPHCIVYNSALTVFPCPHCIVYHSVLTVFPCPHCIVYHPVLTVFPCPHCIVYQPVLTVSCISLSSLYCVSVCPHCALLSSQFLLHRYTESRVVVVCAGHVTPILSAILAGGGGAAVGPLDTEIRTAAVSLVTEEI